MPRIECLAEREVTETVGGTTYSFQRDNEGRFVATVTNAKHARCFLNLPMYRDIDKAESKPEQQPAPKADQQKQGSPDTEKPRRRAAASKRRNQAKGKGDGKSQKPETGEGDGSGSGAKPVDAKPEPQQAPKADQQKQGSPEGDNA